MAPKFSPKRIAHFIYRDLVLLKGTLITSLAVAGGALFLFSLFGMIMDKNLTDGEFTGIFGLFYILTGLVFTFAIFREAQHKKMDHLYFALPVSPLERLIGAWFTTTVLYTLVFSIVAPLIGQFAILVGSVVFRADFHMLSLFQKAYWQVVKVYFFIHPVFLLGAIAFGKNRVGKTLLFLVLLVLGLVFYNMLLYGILNHGHGVFDDEALASYAFDSAKNDFVGAGIVLFAGILGPVLLLTAYVKMLEKEV